MTRNARIAASVGLCLAFVVHGCASIRQHPPAEVAAEAKAAADRYCDARAQALHLAREALGEAGAP